MSGQRHLPGEDTLARLRRNDALCDRFEALLATDRGASVTAFLRAEGVPPETADPDLLRDLREVAEAYRGTPPGGGSGTSEYSGRPADTATLPADDTADPDPAAPGPPAVPGYEILGPIAAGGMGAVYRARELALGRDVAVKVPKDRPAAAAAAGRFAEEARLTGRLEHPAVPPVFEFGALADGSPFLAMKLIRGETLRDLLGRRPPGPDGLSRPVAVFEQVCQGVAYAHSRGVIHRDLKPANVMVGEFGEVQVMDWGLAKELGGPPPPAAGPEPAKAPTDDPGPTRTVPGAVMGTPAFMAPEQARGEGDRVDRRSDVFGLGAILCAILTGRPPYVGGDSRSVLRLAAAADLAAASARLGACGADPELVALCRRCLSPDPADRPADAGAVAAAVADLREAAAERVRRAELDRAAAETRAGEAVRRRKVLYALAGVLLVGVVTSAALAVYAANGWRHATNGWGQADKANQDLGVANRALAGTNEALTASVKSEQEANHKVADVLVKMVSSVTGDSLASQRVISPEQKQLLADALPYFEELARKQGETEPARRRTADAAYNVALIQGRLGQSKEALASARRASDEYAKLRNDFPTNQYLHRLSLCRMGLGAALEMNGQPRQAEGEFDAALALIEPLATGPGADPRHRDALAACHLNRGVLALKHGQPDKAEDHVRRAQAIFGDLSTQFPDDVDYPEGLAATHNSLGLVLQGKGKAKDAAEQFQKAALTYSSLLEKLPGNPKYQEELAGRYLNLGRLHREMGELKSAEAALDKGLTILVRLVALYPAVPRHRADLATGRNNYGLLLEKMARPKDAAAQYQQAKALGEKLVPEARDPRDRLELARSHYYLGKLHAGLGGWKSAADEFAKSLPMFQALAADFPDVPEYRRELASNHNDSGTCLQMMNQWRMAEEEHRTAVEIQEKLVKENDAESKYKDDLAVSYHNWALVLGGTRRVKEAEEKLVQARNLLKETTKGERPEPHSLGHLAEVYTGLGNLLMDDPRRYQAAFIAHNNALALRERLVKEYPELPEHAAHLGGAYCNIGLMHQLGGRDADGLNYFRKAIDTLSPIHATNPGHVTTARYLKNSHMGRGMVLLMSERFDGAAKDLTEVVKLSPPDDPLLPTIRIFRAASLARSKQEEAAIEEAEELRKLPGLPADSLYHLASVYALGAKKVAKEKQNYADQAMAQLQKAMKAGFTAVDMLRHDRALDSIRDREDFKRLLKE